MSQIDRRRFLAASGSVALGAGVHAMSSSHAPAPAGTRHPGDDHRGPCVIASGNGLNAVGRAMEVMRGGADPVDAVVAGVTLVEDDPNDMTVGYGGLPNEQGVVQLDASVMHGPSHKAGAVGALENVRNAAAVALKVLRHTDHVMLVGKGALDFARAHGFQEQNLLTDRARQAWLTWKENLSPDDDWLDRDQRGWDDKGNPEAAYDDLPFTNGTINCCAVNEAGDLSAVTTTSGLSYKLPGRVGDSPIVGAGMYVDNDVGAAGATGRGEAVIQSCGAYSIVGFMQRGLSPTEACLEAIRQIIRNTRQKRLLDGHGRPRFNVTMYALRKDGAYGSASLYGVRSFAVQDGAGARLVQSAWVYERQE